MTIAKALPTSLVAYPLQGPMILDPNLFAVQLTMNLPQIFHSTYWSSILRVQICGHSPVMMPFEGTRPHAALPAHSDRGALEVSQRRRRPPLVSNVSTSLSLGIIVLLGLSAVTLASIDRPFSFGGRFMGLQEGSSGIRIGSDRYAPDDCS